MRNSSGMSIVSQNQNIKEGTNNALFVAFEDELIAELGDLISRKKATSQSSTGWQGTSDRAVDGKTSGQYKDGYVIRKIPSGKQLIQKKLCKGGRSYTIVSITNLCLRR